MNLECLHFYCASVRTDRTWGVLNCQNFRLLGELEKSRPISFLFSLLDFFVLFSFFPSLFSDLPPSPLSLTRMLVKRPHASPSAGSTTMQGFYFLLLSATQSCEGHALPECSDLSSCLALSPLGWLLECSLSGTRQLESGRRQTDIVLPPSTLPCVLCPSFRHKEHTLLAARPERPHEALGIQ